MESFEIDDLLLREPAERHTYDEFLRSDLLSLGLAIWPAGSIDDQQPHTEEEIYYVVKGRGKITVNSEDQEVKPGSIIYVPAGTTHRFNNILEDLQVLVFWAPPWRSRAQTT